MGYNKENFKRIRAEYETKTFLAQEEADRRRTELYAAIPGLKEKDQMLSSVGLQIMKAVLGNADPTAAIAELRKTNERIQAERAALLRVNGFPANYSDPQYDCDDCRDTGYVGIQMCACMKRRLIEAGMESSGLSGLMKTQSFENFSLDYYKDNPKEYEIMRRNYQIAYQYANAFAIGEGDKKPENLLFLGGTGLGKTHLSTAVARVVINRGYDVFYNSAVGLISDFEFQRFGNSHIADSSFTAVRHCGLALTTSFCRDEDHSVCSSGTIQ
jgi:DNA replication protein DnaC